MRLFTPDQLRRASIDQFRLGRIAAPIVIELGLGYLDTHLLADHKKLKESKIEHGYLSSPPISHAVSQANVHRKAHQRYAAVVLDPALPRRIILASGSPVLSQYPGKG